MGLECRVGRSLMFASHDQGTYERPPQSRSKGLKYAV